MIQFSLGDLHVSYFKLEAGFQFLMETDVFLSVFNVKRHFNSSFVSFFREATLHGDEE